MGKGSDAETERKLSAAAAVALLEGRTRILEEWETRVRRDFPEAASLPQPILIDTLPIFLRNLAEALDEGHPRATATESSSVAQEHGGERARITTFGPDQILREYQILRDVVSQELERAGSVSDADRSVVQRSFDLAIQESIMAYFFVQASLRNQFVATLSHDLRNPLGAAKLSADILLRKLKSPLTEETLESARTLVNRIQANLQRGDRMIQYLLNSNSLQAGERLTIEIQSGDLHGLVSKIAEEMSADDRRRIVVEGESAPFHGDKALLERAVENLLTNAVKYGPPDQKITLRVQTCAGRVMVAVHNEGPPIPIEEQGRLFQTLQRTSSARQSGKQGWGLGLAFVRGVCESHGGSVGVESSAGLGTTFTIDIPADARLLPTF